MQILQIWRWGVLQCSGSGHQLNSSCLWSGSLSTACTEYKVQVTKSDLDAGEGLQKMYSLIRLMHISLVTAWKIYHQEVQWYLSRRCVAQVFRGRLGFPVCGLVSQPWLIWAWFKSKSNLHKMSAMICRGSTNRGLSDCYLCIEHCAICWRMKSQISQNLLREQVFNVKRLSEMESWHFTVVREQLDFLIAVVKYDLWHWQNRESYLYQKRCFDSWAAGS